MKKRTAAVLALFALWAMHVNFGIIGGASVSDVAIFFSQYVAPVNFMDIAAFACAFMLITHITERDGGVDVPLMALAVAFSLLYTVSFSFYKFNSLSFFNANGLQVIIALGCLLGYTILFYFVLRLLWYAFERVTSELETGQKQRSRFEKFLDRRFFVISFALIAVCWLTWTAANYPGTFCYDSMFQLSQYFGRLELTAHHPPLGTFIIGAFASFGKLLGSLGFGCWLYTVFQSLLGAFVFSYGLEKLRRAGLRSVYCLAGTLFFALTALWGCFAQWIEKDMLYTEILILFVIWFTECVTRREITIKDAVRLGASGLLTCLLGKGGIYIILPSLAVLFIYVTGKSKLKLAASSAVLAAVYCAVTGFVYPALLGIEDGSVIEALSVPVQQTARYVAYYGDEVTEKEREAIAGVLDYDRIAEKYDPQNSDNIKGLYTGDKDKLGAYFATWIKMFFKHPDVYISAFINNNFGYLAPVDSYLEPLVSTQYGEEYGFLLENGIYDNSIQSTGNTISNLLRQLSMRVPLVRYLDMTGLYTWIMLVCVVFLMKKREWHALISFVPILLMFCFCLVGPLSNSTRYALPMIAAAPMMTGYTNIAGDACVKRKRVAT